MSRETASRELLFVSLVESLVLHGRIKTTKTKAKAITGLIDRLVVLAKKETLDSKRQILKRLKGNKDIATKLWTTIAKTFANRPSGFTRAIPLASRKGDLASMVRLEWVEEVKNDVKDVPTKAKRS